MDEQKTQVVFKMTAEPGTEPNSCWPLDQQQEAKLTDEQAPATKTTNQNELGPQSDQNPQIGQQIQIEQEPTMQPNKNDSCELIQKQQINENIKEQIIDKSLNQIANQITTFSELNSTQKVHVYQINNLNQKMEQQYNSNILNLDAQIVPHQGIQTLIDSGQINNNQYQAVVQTNNNQNPTAQQNIINNSEIVQEDKQRLDQIVADKVQIGNQNSAGDNFLECQEQIQSSNPVEQTNQQDETTDKKTNFVKLQPFQKNNKRQQWDSQFGYLITTSVESEKQKLNDNMKPPRKPLSPYLFFSQEKRKVIKQERPELNAKQIMKIVSKEWQEITDEKNKEVYEYLSLRDRELYDILCKHWKSIKEEAHKMGQQVENVYEPMAGTIAHSVSRRSKMNQAQPNNAVQSSNQLYNGLSAEQSATQLEIYEQLTQTSRLGKRRGRPPKNSMDEGSQPLILNNSDVKIQKQASGIFEVDGYVDSQQNKRATKANEKVLLKTQKLAEIEKISKINDSDQTDQNEKVRRIFEEKLPKDNKDRLPNLRQFLGPEPSQSQRTQTSKKGRSQRASADITRQYHVETSLLMQQEEQLAQLKNHKSEQKKKRKQSNQMQSHVGVENKTSHSDQEENQQNPPAIAAVNNEEQQIQQNNQQPIENRMELIRPPKLTIKDTKAMKQPNKLKNLFGSEPENENENQENSYQIEVNCNMQKRPSTHKNIITYNKIDIAQVNNTTLQKEEQLTEPKINPEKNAEIGDQKPVLQINPIQYNQFQQLSQQMMNSQNIITNQPQQEYIYPFLNNNGALNVINQYQFNQNNKMIPQQVQPQINNGPQNFNQQRLQGSQNNFNLINIQIPPPAIPLKGFNQLMNSQSPQRRNFSSDGLRYGNNDDMIDEPPESPTRAMFQGQQIPSNMGQQSQQFVQDHMERFPMMIRSDSMQRVTQPNMSRIVNGNTPLTDNSNNNLAAPPRLMPYNLFMTASNQLSNNQDNNLNNLNE